MKSVTIAKNSKTMRVLAFCSSMLKLSLIWRSWQRSFAPMLGSSLLKSTTIH
ncbi:Uncharacterised protein [Collinsella aerofaciens]|nr:Uncharacterised protein [Collinsella aerofaciens]